MSTRYEHVYEEIDCRICETGRELKLLPCNHKICVVCLNELVTEASRMARTPICLICGEEFLLTRESDYITCKAAAEFKEKFESLNPTNEEVKSGKDKKAEVQPTLGAGKIVSSLCCYSVSTKPVGELLVGSLGRFDVLNTNGHAIGSQGVAKASVVGVQFYNERTYTLCNQLWGTSERYVMVYDSDTLEELWRWSVPEYLFNSNIAVANDKVYVPDPPNKLIIVYSLTGNFITCIHNSSFRHPVYLAVSPAQSVIVSDFQANRLYHINSSTDTVTWICKAVRNPSGICCDDNGLVWVWSKKSKSLFLLSSESGEVQGEIKDDRFSALGGDDFIIGMSIITTENRMLLAAARRKGLLQFCIT